MPMAEETTTQFLQRRRAELSAQISALKGQLSPKEFELAQIDKMLVVLGLGSAGNALTGHFGSGLRPFLDNPGANALMIDSALSASAADFMAPVGDVIDPTDRYSKMTIKQLVVQAFLDAFPHAATTQELRNFIHSGYGREIEQSSLRPQLHRLKADLVLLFDGNLQAWKLNPEKRKIYTLYDHSRSREAMKELQDEPVSPGARTLAAGGGFLDD